MMYEQINIFDVTMEKFKIVFCSDLRTDDLGKEAKRGVRDGNI